MKSLLPNYNGFDYIGGGGGCTRMSIAESMSRGYSIRNGEWTFIGDYDRQHYLEINQKLNAPKNSEEALKVARREA